MKVSAHTKGRQGVVIGSIFLHCVFSSLFPLVWCFEHAMMRMRGLEMTSLQLM